MNLGFASPISLQLLRDLVSNGEMLPPGYLFAPAADWVKELMRRGHHVTLYTTAREVDVPQTFKGDSLTIRIAKQRSRGTGRDLFAQERKQLVTMMLEDKCDLIHAHWTYEFALAALDTGIPTLVTIHDQPWRVLAHFRDMHRAARLLMAYQVAFRARYFTAVSDAALTHFRRYLNPGAKIRMIPNGLPESIFDLGRKVTDRGGKELTLATILQGWSLQKNAVTALEAFARLREEIPNAKLEMIGTAYELGGPAHQWAKMRNLDIGVEFIGALTYGDLLERIKTQVDIVVHPSINETFSMTVLEAMALAKPVIVGKKTPGMIQIMGGDDSGMLVDVRNSKAIAKAMVCLGKDRAFRERIASAAFTRVAKYFRLEKVMDQYEGAYVSMHSAQS